MIRDWKMGKKCEIYLEMSRKLKIPSKTYSPRNYVLLVFYPFWQSEISSELDNAISCSNFSEIVKWKMIRFEYMIG